MTRAPNPKKAAAQQALRATLDEAAREARTAQRQLQEATAQFAAVSQRVVAVVGGSAQGVDTKLVQALEAANHQVDEAGAALATAVTASRRAA